MRRAAATDMVSAVKRWIALLVVCSIVAAGCSSKPDAEASSPAPAAGAPASGEGPAALPPGQLLLLAPAILVAIALPTFLGARDRANDKAAQSSIRNALAAAKTYFVDDDSYAGFDPQVGVQIEPSLEWTTGPSTGPIQVSIVSASPTQIVLESMSESGRAFCLRDTAAGPAAGTFYGTIPAETPQGGYQAVKSADCGSAVSW